MKGLPSTGMGFCRRGPPGSTVSLRCRSARLHLGRASRPDSRQTSMALAGIIVSFIGDCVSHVSLAIAHYSAQYAGGAVGPMVIHGPLLNAIYDVDLGPIMLSDWYHQDYYTLVNNTMHGAVPASNNNLVSTRRHETFGSNRERLRSMER